MATIRCEGQASSAVRSALLGAVPKCPYGIKNAHRTPRQPLTVALAKRSADTMSGLGMRGQQGNGGESAAMPVPVPAPAAGEEKGLAKIQALPPSLALARV
jgi:hypothetical protein